jgi:hypothetical protein
MRRPNREPVAAGVPKLSQKSKFIPERGTISHQLPGLIVAHVGCGERSEPHRSRKASTDAVPTGHRILRWPSGISGANQRQPTPW